MSIRLGTEQIELLVKTFPRSPSSRKTSKESTVTIRNYCIHSEESIHLHPQFPVSNSEHPPIQSFVLHAWPIPVDTSVTRPVQNPGEG